MYYLKNLIIFTLLLSGFNSFAEEGPVPLPDSITVKPAAPKNILWQKLSAKEKNFAYYILEADRLGRTILYDQTHRHGLKLRKALTTSVNKKNFNTTRELLGDTGFQEYLVFVAKFLDNYGPYDMRSQLKYVLNKVKPEQVRALWKLYGTQSGAVVENEIVRLLTDPTYEVRRKPNEDGKGLETTGTNLYEKGLTGEAVLEALEKMQLEIQLNCRVIKTKNGPACDIQTIHSKSETGRTLQKIAKALQKAKIYALNSAQTAQIDHFLKYLDLGNEKQFRDFNIEWLKVGNAATIDFMIGWVEVYDDWLSRIGSWESYLLIVDKEVTKKVSSLAKNAQYFENKMPYDYQVDGKTVAFRKTFPPDYAPPAIMSYYFEEIGPMRTSGFNLPNYEDIRRDIGFKNVIKLPLPGEAQNPTTLKQRREVVEAYAPADKVEDILKHYDLVRDIHVLLHEIIGHGSGTFDPEKYTDVPDPMRALGPLGSSLEEERADLAGLVFGADPMLVQTGIVPDATTLETIKKIKWDQYLAIDFSSALGRAKSFGPAHLRGRFLLISYLLEANAIGWASRVPGAPMTNENRVLRVLDYEKCHAVAVKLLSELQRIKALRDETALKNIYAKYAPKEAIQDDWAQALISRGLNLTDFKGFVDQPWQISKDKKKIQAFGGETLESVAPYWSEFYGN